MSRPKFIDACEVQMANDLYRSGEYLRVHPTWHAEDSAWKAEQIARILRANGIQPRSMCDIGCGAGEVLRGLSGYVDGSCALHGFDVSPQAVALARDTVGPKAEIRLIDSIDDVDCFCDVMLLIDVIEHVEDYYGYLRGLKPKSTYKVLHIPLDLSVQSVLRSGPILGNRRTAGHIHYFTKELALEVLTDTGYTVIDMRYTAGAVELPARTWNIQVARLPRRLLASLNQDIAARLLGGFSLLVLAA